MVSVVHKKMTEFSCVRKNMEQNHSEMEVLIGTSSIHGGLYLGTWSNERGSLKETTFDETGGKGKGGY